MSGSARSSEGLDPRRRRILYRSWHRGTREMDLLMGPFADARLAGLNDAELAEFEALIDVPDQELFAWIMGAENPPGEHDGPVFRALKAFHHDKPLHS